MSLLEEKVYTIDDIYALPEGERAELIDGHIYYMAPPNRTHQKISMEITLQDSVEVGIYEDLVIDFSKLL